MTTGDQGGPAGQDPAGSGPQEPPQPYEQPAPYAPGPGAPGYGPPAGYGSPAGYGPPAGYGAVAQPGPAQPGPPYAPAGAPPDNYLVWAILSTVLCCLPLGIVSIVFAAQVNDKWLAGDVAGAMESSRKARQFAIWSAVATAIGFGLVVVFYIGMFAVVAGFGVATSP